MPIVVGVKRWALIVGTAAIVFSGLSFGAYITLLKPVPSRPTPCVDAIAVLEKGMIVNCNPGETGELTTVNEKAFFKCTCPKSESHK